MFIIFATLVSIGVSDIDRTVRSTTTGTAEFRLAGQITAAACRRFVLSDQSGSVWVRPRDNARWEVGDYVSLDCNGYTASFGIDIVDVHAQRLTVQRHGTPPPVMQCTTSDIEAGKADFSPVRVKGVISEAFRDEVNPDWAFLLLESLGTRSVVVCHDCGTNSAERLASIIDSGVEITGVCVPADCGFRRYLGRKIYISSLGAIQFLSTSGIRASGQGEIANLTGPMSADDRLFPHRRQLTGTVIASRSDGRFFLRTDKDRCVRVHLMRGTPAPSPGHYVAVAGFLRTDLFFAKLINAAIIQDSGDAAPTNDVPLDISAKDILYDSSGRPKVNPSFDGRIIRISGAVRDINPDHLNKNAFYVESDGVAIAVEARLSDHPQANSIVQVTGMCLITSQNEDDSDGFTRLNGFSVITRDGSDVKTTARAPWWTADRLVKAIWCLLAGMLGIFLWNRVLGKMVERRGKELLKEQVAKINAFLKTRERTRLAVELHDSFSQSLKGISLRIDTALKAIKLKPDAAERNLLMASHMLTSCHEELRDCIRDLRDDVYSDGDVTESIRAAAARNAEEAEVSVHCDIPRKRLTDSTFHSILMIIRELSSNAARHGKARHIAIEARFSSGLSIEVSDDGSGFDPTDRPGVLQGHFGLQGVAERVESLNGSLRIESAPGKGSHISVFIPFRRPDNEAD